jgi:hypothetical protein
VSSLYAYSGVVGSYSHFLKGTTIRSPTKSTLSKMCDLIPKDFETLNKDFSCRGEHKLEIMVYS